MRIARSFSGLFLALALAGCDSRAPAPTSVHGKVFFNGIPLHTGTIIFTPDPLRGTLGPLVRAELQSDGCYVLSTDDESAAAEGWYRVTIVALELSSAFGQDGRRLVPRSLLPDKYRDPELSGLVCEIRPGQENCINFNLD